MPLRAARNTISRIMSLVRIFSIAALLVLVPARPGHARPEPIASVTPLPSDAPAAGSPATVQDSVALVDWQFPTTASTEIRVHPLQRLLLQDKAHASLRPAFYPHLSEENAKDSERGLAKLVQHAERTYRAYVAGRKRLGWPFLLNISEKTPAAMRLLIAHGVRVFSFSSGSKTRLAGLEAVVRDHPAVLFVVATPHISGNSITPCRAAERTRHAPLCTGDTGRLHARLHPPRGPLTPLLTPRLRGRVERMDSQDERD